MARLLPSTPDVSAVEDAEPRVIGVDSEDADDLLAAMSSETARNLLATLHDDPAPPSALSDRVDTSLQNVQYHLGRLEEAGAVEVIDTVYSEKGREMAVYAPADKPLVVVAGGEDETTGLRAALASLLGGLGLVALLGVLVQGLFGGPLFDEADGGVGDGGGTMSTMEAGTPEPTPVAAAGGPFDGLAGALSEPGVVFFLGGAAVLLVGFAVWAVRR